MKKSFSILLLILLLSLFFGCLPKRPVPVKKKVPVFKPVEPSIILPEVEEKEEEEEYEYVEYMTAEDLFYSAVEKYNDEFYETSYILFDEILKQYPEDSLVEDSLIYQARLLYSKEFYEQSYKKYEEVLLKFPDTRFVEECNFYIFLCYHWLGWEEKAAEKKEEFITNYPYSEYIKDITLLKADDFYFNEDYKNAFETYVEYYKLIEDEDKKKEIRDTATRIIDSALAFDELQSIVDNYFDKFPTAYIKLRLAKMYLDKKNIEDAKLTLLEIMEFFPTFEKIDEVEKYLERIELRVITKPEVIACLLPLSGKYKTYGQRLLAGVMLAAEVFSEDEIDKPFTIIIKDTKGDPETALKLLEEAYRVDRAIAVIGPLLSKNATLCAERAEELNIPIMLMTQKEDITKDYGYVYRKFITNTKQVSALLDYSVNSKNISRYAIMYPDTAYGNEILEIFFDEVIKRGAQIVAAESYDVNKNDFSAEIKKIVGLNDLKERKRLRKLWVSDVLKEEKKDMAYMVRSGKMKKEEAEGYLKELKKELLKEDYRPVVDFQAIFVPDNYSRAGLIIPQLLYHDIDKDVLKLGTSAYNSSKLIDIAKDNSNGIVFVDGFFKDSNDKDVKDFVKIYTDTFNTEPTILEAESYDSAKMIISLIRDNDLQDREELKKALDRLENYKGVTGVVRTFQDGDADEDLVLLTVVREKIRQLAVTENNESETE